MRYRISSLGNGAFLTITRVADGASVFLQGDDARRFRAELTYATPWQVEVGCAAYDSIMRIAG